MAWEWNAELLKTVSLKKGVSPEEVPIEGDKEERARLLGTWEEKQQKVREEEQKIKDRDLENMEMLSSLLNLTLEEQNEKVHEWRVKDAEGVLEQKARAAVTN